MVRPSGRAAREWRRGGGEPPPPPVAALRDLTRFGVLTAGHLGRLHFPGEDAAVARLEELARAGHVRVQPPIYGGRVVYLATRAGARRSGAGLGPANFISWLVPHQLAVADVAIALLPLYPGARWITERELRRDALRARHRPAPGHTAAGGSHPPDGALALPGVFVAIEVELTSKDGVEYTRILRWYAGALHISRVVWFCPSAALRRRLSVLVRKEGLDDLVWVQPLPPGVEVGPWG